jgi:hypothetical protein
MENQEFEIGEIIKWQAHNKNCWGIFMEDLGNGTCIVIIREAEGVPMALKSTILTNLLKKHQTRV